AADPPGQAAAGTGAGWGWPGIGSLTAALSCPLRPDLLQCFGPPRARFTLGTGARRSSSARGRWSPARVFRRGAWLPRGPHGGVPLLEVGDAVLLPVGQPHHVELPHAAALRAVD